MFKNKLSLILLFFTFTNYILINSNPKCEKIDISEKINKQTWDYEISTATFAKNNLVTNKVNTEKIDCLVKKIEDYLLFRNALVGQNLRPAITQIFTALKKSNLDFLNILNIIRQNYAGAVKDPSSIDLDYIAKIASSIRSLDTVKTDISKTRKNIDSLKQKNPKDNEFKDILEILELFAKYRQNSMDKVQKDFDNFLKENRIIRKGNIFEREFRCPPDSEKWPNENKCNCNKIGYSFYIDKCLKACPVPMVAYQGQCISKCPGVTIAINSRCLTEDGVKGALTSMYNGSFGKEILVVNGVEPSNENNWNRTFSDIGNYIKENGSTKYQNFFSILNQASNEIFNRLKLMFKEVKKAIINDAFKKEGFARLSEINSKNINFKMINYTNIKNLAKPLIGQIKDNIFKVKSGLESDIAILQKAKIIKGFLLTISSSLINIIDSIDKSIKALEQEAFRASSI